MRGTIAKREDLNVKKRKKTVVVTQFKWAGRLGPFRIKSSCGECDLTTSFLKNVIESNFNNADVKFKTMPWLNNFFYCLFRAAWHAPIIMVNGRKFYQFSKKEPLFDKERLVELIKENLQT